MDDAPDINRRFWDGLAAVHADATPGSYYDVDPLIRGERPLGDWEERALASVYADLAGVDVVYVQSHIGIDGIVMAQRGANVTAVDFSATAIETGKAIAARAGVELDWIEADANALPASLEGRFDLAWVTIGAIVWIEDLTAYIAGVARLLKPGGHLVMVEMHPMLQTVESLDPPVLDAPYAFSGPEVFEEDGDYADPEAKVRASKSVAYAHSLGETVTATLDAGLELVRFEEHLDSEFDPRGDILAREDDGRYRLRITGQALPIFFTLVARRSDHLG